MTYPGYGGQPPQYSPFGSDPSPVPDVSQPVTGFPPPPAGPPPMSVPVMSVPPASGPPISGPPFSSPFPPPMAPAYQFAPVGRPTVVSLAVTLTFVGVGIAFVGTLLGHLALADLARQDTPAEVRDLMRAMSGISTFIAAGVNLVGAAGVSICAISAMRGSNGGRITLCVLCGLFAGWKLMCGGYNLLIYSQDTMDEALAQLGGAVRYLYGAVAADLFLMFLAIAILVLLLTGPANRYFSPPRVPAPAMPYQLDV